MKLFAVPLLASVLSAHAYSATGATIVAKNENSKTVVIALDSKGTPRVNGNSKTYPTIKNFRDGYDYSAFCYTGTQNEAEVLLTALVASANGDGDSWAELKSIKSNRKNQITVVASITDESGEKDESYVFSACK